MDKNKVAGSIKEIKGAAKEAIGIVSSSWLKREFVMTDSNRHARSRTMASPNRGSAVGLTFFVATLSCGLVPAEAQTAQSYAVRHYGVGDQIPSSVQFDDDGFPDRPYAILIVDRAVVVVIDRATRRVVEVH